MKNKRLEERRKKIPEWIDKAVKYYFDRIDDNIKKSDIEILSEVSGYSETELGERISDTILQPIDALTAMAIVKLLAAPAVVGQSEQLNCDHEWKCDTFDCYGFPVEKYCEKCGKKEAI